MEVNVIVGISVGSALIVSAVIAKVVDIRQKKRQAFKDRINGTRFGRPVVKPFRRVSVKKG